MNKFLVLYWEPGSGGDLIQRLLLLQYKKIQGVVADFTLSKEARVVPVLTEQFQHEFDHDEEYWYFRTWSKDDCVRLNSICKDLDCEYFVIPTHDREQQLFLEQNLNNASTIGINYPENMFLGVLKNWCKKNSPYDHRLSKIYNKPVHDYLKKNNSFGEFVLSEQLKYGSRIKKQVNDNFDYCISLENLYNRDLSDIEMLLDDTDSTQDVFDQWLSKQNPIYQYQVDICDELKHALGYNSKLLHQSKIDLPLDAFDNVLIKHRFSKVSQNFPRFGTLLEANNFIKTVACDNYV